MGIIGMEFCKPFYLPWCDFLRHHSDLHHSPRRRKIDWRSSSCLVSSIFDNEVANRGQDWVVRRPTFVLASLQGEESPGRLPEVLRKGK